MAYPTILVEDTVRPESAAVTKYYRSGLVTTRGKLSADKLSNPGSRAVENDGEDAGAQKRVLVDGVAQYFTCGLLSLNLH